MQVREVLSAFIEHEERASLFERSARGVRYWQAIRHDVFQETLHAARLAERAHLRIGELPIRSWLPAQLRALPTTLRRSLLALPRADLLVANHPRHVLHDGRYICPYSQPLLDATPHSRAILEGQFQGRYPTPVPDQPTAYIDLALLASHAEFRAKTAIGAGLSKRELAEIAELREGLQRGLGFAPPLAAVARRVRTAVIAHLGLRPRYERLLDRVQPRLVIVVIGYRLVNQVLTQVAHERGLAVAELQHGSLGETHPAYNFAPGRKPESFPDELLLFGDLWRQATPGLPLSAAHTPAIGYAWLEMQGARYERVSPAEPKRVLFLSQRSIGPELSRAAARLRELVPAERLHISYRLHPSEHIGWRETYPELARSAIEVQAAHSAPLYAVQRDSDLQVGVYSTALLEGLAFGLPTYVLAISGHEQLRILTTTGAAQLVADADSLAKVILEPAAAAEASEALWARGATARFEAFLGRVLRP